MSFQNQQSSVSRMLHRKIASIKNITFAALVCYFCLSFPYFLSSYHLNAPRLGYIFLTFFSWGGSSRIDNSAEIHQPLRSAIQLNAQELDTDLPWIFFITPTTLKLTQKADLTRLSQTLQLVPKIHWILVEDAANRSSRIGNLLLRLNLQFTHLAVPRKIGTVGRGMPQRCLALDWLRQNYENSKEVQGVVYFGDDDNSYDIRLFEFIRKVKTVGVWPVGISGGGYVEAPKVKNGTVIGWDSQYLPKRDYALDMASFGVNLGLILQQNNATFRNDCREGMFETCFLKQIGIPLEELEVYGMEEPKEVLVWHTKTQWPTPRKGTRVGFDI